MSAWKAVYPYYTLVVNDMDHPVAVPFLVGGVLYTCEIRMDLA
jgi:hypothetical protein